MSFDLEIIDPTKYEGWDEILLSAQGYSFFHSCAWAKVLYESYQYKPLYFTAIENGCLKTLVPVMEVSSFLTGKRGVSLPFSDYCEPIISNGVSFKDVFEGIMKYGKGSGWKYLELRGGQQYLPDALTSATYLSHILELSRNEEETFLSFRDSTKRNIKRAISEGVEARICNSLESVAEFYRLNLMTRKRHGLPPQPFYFFEKVFDHIILKNLGFIVLAYFQDTPVAGAVYFHFGRKAVYKYGASDMNYQHLRANNLVMWEAVKWYSENGHKSLHLGRTEPENRGLIQFKSGWEAYEQQIAYYRYDFERGNFVPSSPKVTGFHNKIFKKTPIYVLNKVGGLLYRHVG
jgi:hypothetical protein